MKLKIIDNYIILFFFFIYLLSGLFIVNSFPVTPDETLHRENGFISLKYISDLFNFDLKLNDFYGDIPFLYEDWRKTYGTLFDLPIAFIEFYFQIEDKKLVFLIRHIANFLIFYLSCIYFFFLLKNNFKNKYLSLVGVIILVLSPRIFGHSFYNSKDIIFLSLLIIAVFYSLKLLREFTYKNFFLSFIFCAFASNIRIIGIYLPILTIFFYIFSLNKIKKNNLNFILLYLIGFFLILYFSWPYLWLNPLSNFLTIFSESMNYPAWWNFKILYFGKYINPENLPWHYFFFWFFSTTPPFFLFLIVIGLYQYIKFFIKNFLNINFKRDIYLWKSNYEMTSIFMLLLFFIPIFFVITLNSTLYNGWRHLYFVYPAFIYFSIYFLNHLIKENKKGFFKLIILFLSIQFILNLSFIYKSHPVQNIYFNIFSKKFVQNKFPIDYWGVGNLRSINELIKKNNNLVSISTASYTNLFNLIYSKNIDLKKINLLGTSELSKQESNFLFTNFYFHDNPKRIKKYIIPKNFISYQKFYIDNLLINEIFVKK